MMQDVRTARDESIKRDSETLRAMAADLTDAGFVAKLDERYGCLSFRKGHASFCGRVFRWLFAPHYEIRAYRNDDFRVNVRGRSGFCCEGNREAVMHWIANHFA